MIGESVFFAYREQIRGLLLTSCFLVRGMKLGFLGFDRQSHKATIYDSGDSQLSTTTLPTIGEAVRGILHHPEETANKFVYVASFTTSQNEVLRALEQATGKKWEIGHKSTAETAKLGQEKLQKGDPTAVYDLLRASLLDGKHGAAYSETRTLANELLGLPKETVEGAVKIFLEG